MLDFFSADKPPSFENVLQKLSEFGKCLLTGDAGKLTFVPVDTNPQNFLPSNMVSISDEIAKNITYTIFYSAELGPYEIAFDSSPVFLDYNLAIVNMLNTQFKLDFNAEFGTTGDHNRFLELFEYLTRKHIKGIAQISYTKGDSKISIDSNQVQGCILREISKAATTAKQSKIITSPGIGLVK